VTLSANYTLSLSKIDLTYAGFGVTNFDGTPFPPNHQFAFGDAPSVRHDSHVADVRLEFPLPVRDVMMVTGYTFDYYKVRDWQQDFAAAWYEPVNTEFLLRDTAIASVGQPPVQPGGTWRRATRRTWAM
jgi:hypothetical protein